MDVYFFRNHPDRMESLSTLRGTVVKTMPTSAPQSLSEAWDDAKQMAGAAPEVISEAKAVYEEAKGKLGAMYEEANGNALTTIKQLDRVSCFCPQTKDRSTFETILENIDLPEVQKQILQSRYIDIIENFRRRVARYSCMFHMGHIIITVGSLFVPALLSIQNSNAATSFGSSISTQVYWATFVVSLLVTIFNGILTLFKIDKKYYFLNTTLERLRTEGWQYFGLTGRYGGHLIGDQTPTHVNQFIFFTHQIEKIKMKQVEEEYYKSDEKSDQAPTSAAATQKSSELYPPSLNQPIATLDIPDPVKEAVNTLIRSHKIIDSNMDGSKLDRVKNNQEADQDSLQNIVISHGHE